MFPRWCNFLTSIQCKQTKSTQIKKPEKFIHEDSQSFGLQNI